eukprot:comp7119_c0_seq1/m.2850 comp7119_c0_seq1/g.2850  ORF comp7119_c0_seq1/g.2850 comp7119_c0_seq1/m.2850 type:complete len:459 (-) comp7119_c0_seq1:453-1829(-)
MADENLPGAPQDRFWLLRSSFVLQAVGMLLPWNAFITIYNYWGYKLEGSQFYGNYMNYFTFVNTAFLFFASIFFSRTQHMISLHTRVLVPLAVNVLLFTLCLALVFIDSVQGDLFFYITITIVALCAVCIGFQQPGIYSISSFLPNIYTLFTVQGEAWGGLLVSVVNVVTIVASTSTPDAAKAFFGMSVAVMALAFLNYFFIMNSPVFKFWYRHHMMESTDQSNPQLSEAQMVSNESEKGYQKESGELARAGDYVPDLDESNVDWATYMRIFWTVFPLGFAIFYNFVVTLAIFPVVPMNIAPLTSPTVSRFFGDLWVPVYCYVFFNVGDLLARVVGPYMILPKRWVLPFSILRTVFFPFFMLCNVTCWDVEQSQYIPSLLPKVFMNDAWPIVFIFLLSITNGVTYQMAMNYVPDSVKGHERPVANAICQSMMIFGFAIGSLASFGVKAINCPGNPFAS